MIRVLIVDDHPVVREGLSNFLENQTDITVVGQAGDGQEALELIRSERPDVVLMDIEMPGVDGLNATQQIRAEALETRVIVLTVHSERQYVEGLLKAGATGYILKTAHVADVLQAIRLAKDNKAVIDMKPLQTLVDRIPENREVTEAGGIRIRLSKHEIEVLRWIGRGMTNREIGQTMQASSRMVKGWVDDILLKLHASSRSAALAHAIRLGLLKRDEL